MKSPPNIVTDRHVFVIIIVAALSACAAPPPPVTTDDVPNIFEVKTTTGFRLDVTVEEEALNEKTVRAVAETEITSVRRALSRNSPEQCIERARLGDVLLRERQMAPGRMALTGQGAILDQGGAVGKITAEPRVYFLGPMEDANVSTKHQLSDFITTSPEHPALAGAQLETLRLDIVATPAGDAALQTTCIPELGVSRRYEGGGERVALVWHGVNLAGVPERYLAGMLQDTRDVSISILDSSTRVPITNATVKIENLDNGLVNYSRFAENYLSGVTDAFLLNLYAEFADSDFFEFTELKSDYGDGDKIRLLKDQALTLSVSAEASGYQPLRGRINLGAGQANLRILMVPDDESGASAVPPTIATN